MKVKPLLLEFAIIDEVLSEDYISLGIWEFTKLYTSVAFVAKLFEFVRVPQLPRAVIVWLFILRFPETVGLVLEQKLAIDCVCV